MSKQKKWTRLAGGAVMLLLALVMTVSVCVFPTGNTSDPNQSLITMLQGDVNRNMTQFLNSSVMYRLPDKVKDTDELSIIIQTERDSLLDAYDASGRKSS